MQKDLMQIIEKFKKRRLLKKLVQGFSLRRDIVEWNRFKGKKH
jgi:hypothetical protein